MRGGVKGNMIRVRGVVQRVGRPLIGLRRSELWGSHGATRARKK